MEATDNRKQDVAQIIILATSKAAPDDSHSDASAKVPCKNKSKNCVLPAHKKQGKKTPKNKVFKRYCVMCKKSIMPESKYKLHMSEN